MARRPAESFRPAARSREPTVSKRAHWLRSLVALLGRFNWLPRTITRALRVTPLTAPVRPRPDEQLTLT